MDSRENRSDTLLWNILKAHFGHSVCIACYGDPSNPVDVCLECEDCGEVLIDAELYTLIAREDGEGEE